MCKRGGGENVGKRDSIQRERNMKKVERGRSFRVMGAWGEHGWLRQPKQRPAQEGPF